MNHATIAFIGAGNMAGSLIGGLIADGYDAQKIWVTNPEHPQLDRLKQQFNIHTTMENKVGASKADVIVFAVKPQILKLVAEEIAEIIAQKQPLIISIAAGVREPDLRRWLGGNAHVVRCMPNTPALLRCGATALYANQWVTDEQKDLAESILRAVGITVWLNEENKLDAVTALSGSGPAYFFRIMEALERSAAELGLPEKIAHLLTVQTALGAARMALETDDSIEQLRKHVTSPGGTTERALEILATGGVDKLFADALHGAAHRASELGELFGKEKS